MGGLGLLFGKWMAENGAANIALLSRSGKAPSDSTAMYEALSGMPGVKVTAAKCDAGSEDSVLACFKDLRKAAKIAGVIHAAGVLDDHLIMSLKREHFEPVLKPKIDGTLNFHKATKDDKIDFFVLFSSIAAMLGSPGQGNYCAANAFMDAFTLHRRANGLEAAATILYNNLLL